MRRNAVAGESAAGVEHEQSDQSQQKVAGTCPACDGGPMDHVSHAANQPKHQEKWQSEGTCGGGCRQFTVGSEQLHEQCNKQ
jgi:hypothetical protein